MQSYILAGSYQNIALSSWERISVREGEREK